jgi:hypothetical protein
MRKQSPRAKFIARADLKRLAAYAWDAMQLASSHDPDHAKDLKRIEALIYAEVKLQDRRFADICSRLSTMERQLERLGAPQYRVLYKGKKAA